jgi:hypothetical protein
MPQTLKVIMNFTLKVKAEEFLLTFPTYLVGFGKRHLRRERLQKKTT